MAKSKSPTWTDVKPHLQKLSQRDAVGLIHELFQLSADNRNFLVGRLLPAPPAELLEAYRKKMVEPFYPSRGGFGKLQFADAVRGVKDYQQATGDVAGTLDLMLEFVENGTAFTKEFGDIDDRFYAAVERMMARFATLLLSPDGTHLFPRFDERLRVLYVASDGMGWGFTDEMHQMIETIMKRLAAPGSFEPRRYG